MIVLEALTILFLCASQLILLACARAAIDRSMLPPRITRWRTIYPDGRVVRLRDGRNSV
jgi:hypothetical protein